MAYFYQDGKLHVGTPERSEPVQGFLPSPWRCPTYVYDLDDIERRYRALEVALKPIRHAVHYAMKANSHAKILRRLGSLGAGVDTVSGGEITRALESGIDAKKIIFSGVAKTVAEIELALSRGIKQINVESPQELLRVSEVAARLDRVADVAFRLNPDVNPKTHPYITTGFRENKFGMDETFVPELITILNAGAKHLRLRGLTMHIGSLLFDLDVIIEAIEKTLKVHKALVSQGFQLDRLDIGGGLGIHYETGDDRGEFAMIETFGKRVCALLGELGAEIMIEPGRILTARSGLLVSEVQYIKRTANKTFAILDTGMHHLLRPALYGAEHRMLPLKGDLTGHGTLYDVTGPICESSDFLAKGIELPEIRQGDLIGIADAGAYGFSMASRYNLHDLPEEIFISQGSLL